MNPLWPRIWETYGEDPYLVSELGKQVISGYQNNNGAGEQIAACLKHYLAYSDPKTGKDRTNVWLPENYLREYHLPSFKAAVEQGALSVMVNSGLINGLPTHINKYLLTDVLKKELGFSGVVVTDWQDIENVFKRDKVASSYKEAIMLSINAGVDMAMIPYDYVTFCNDLSSLVKENKVSMSRINDAVRRILIVKWKLGLFQKPITELADYPRFGSDDFSQKAYDCAAESITLLKNEKGCLPLKPGAKILVAGPNANSMRTLNGGWSYSWQGEKTELFAGDYHTILASLQNKFGKENVTYFPGVNYVMQGKYFEDTVQSLVEFPRYAAGADYILLCLGENSYTEKPGDLNDLSLSANQQALAMMAAKSGKPVILILNEGRPRVISNIEPFMSAILMIYLPGNYGADALSDILTGKVNPSGKLPITYPRYVNSLAGYIHKPSDQQSNPQGAYDYSADYNPQYDFGFGLSYSSFEYSGLSTDKKEYRSGDTMVVSVVVKNSGRLAGKEVIQLYISDLVASLSPDVKRLRGFEKVMLRPGEEKQVSFRVAISDLSFIGPDNKPVLEPGEFRLDVGGRSLNIRVN
jgi:beta-glucosidase